jgi:hypothetical protein
MVTRRAHQSFLSLNYIYIAPIGIERGGDCVREKAKLLIREEGTRVERTAAPFFYGGNIGGDSQRV